MKRTERREFVMTPAESEDLQDKADRACMPVSQFLRLLIAGYQPPPAPDERFYSQMDALLNRSSEMIALAKQMKFGEATDLILEEGKAIRKLRQDLEHAYLDGERSDFKWQ